MREKLAIGIAFVILISVSLPAIREMMDPELRRYNTFCTQLTKSSGDELVRIYDKASQTGNQKILRKIFRKRKSNGAALAYCYSLNIKRGMEREHVTFPMLLGMEVEVVKNVIRQVSSPDAKRRLCALRSMTNLLDFEIVSKAFHEAQNDKNLQVSTLAKDAIRQHEEFSAKQWKKLINKVKEDEQRKKIDIPKGQDIEAVEKK
ncbi:hypothetical protein [Candidatus Uabimicrobium amorphum]|uniref:Uncharacterized protein n=1 Tax=Uabimicrobium amorphum TaxID=2596890 RepID=A0A5S9IN75_UABAM|nr:hypothetical protein [Candidatus Uabimicrobium amorphum]BBM84959.1 hypothetical protein UABAM_03320 [Candidatus Uabimicrobium amorphum]